MNFKFGLLLVILSGFFNELVFAQLENDPEIENIIESVAEDVEEDYDFSGLIERLGYYKKNPLDINTATLTDLQDLLFLSSLQIVALQDHIRDTGNLLDLLELQSINQFDLSTIDHLLPFITVNPPTFSQPFTWNNLFKNGRHDLLLRAGRILEDQKGFNIPSSSTASHYTGSAHRYFARYRFNYTEHVQVAANMKKDAGEPFFQKPNNSGFDFYSGSFSLRDLKPVKQLVLGDYSLQFGQGLALYTGFGFGKSADISLIPKVGRGLLPYTSTNETLFLRGFATTFTIRGVEITPFISYRNLDASLTTDENTPSVTSLGLSGLHRTPTEIKNKAAVSQTLYGTHLEYVNQRAGVGILAYKTSFGRSFEPGKYAYNQFDFASDQLTNLSVHYRYNFQQVYVYGEFAQSYPGGFAFVNGLLTSLSPKVSLSLLYRKYQRNYYSFFNQALAESTNAVNEEGFYSGLVITFNKKWEFSTYADLFKFPWLKFRIDAPSSGYELFTQITFTPTKKFRAYFRYRLKEKQQNNDGAETLAFLEKVDLQDFRADLSYPLNKKFVFRNRFEMVQYQKGNTLSGYGFLFYQDIIYHPMVSKFSGNLRLAYFSTADYDSRLYAFENDVLYSYSITPFYNRGFRSYINGRYTLHRGLDVWLRYAITFYPGQKTVGSGLDVIDKNRKSEIKTQIRYQF